MAGSHNFVVLPATKTDLPALVDIQLKVFADIPIDRLINGDGNSARRALVVQRHLSHMEENSGLTIVKVEVVDNDDDNHNDKPETTTTSNSGPIIAGFCMFYLPNTLTPPESDPLLRLPPSLRPTTQPITFPHIEDPTSRKTAEDYVNSTHAQLLAIIDGRSCGYVRFMAVDPVFQRQGIGTMLMQWGCKLFDEAGVDAALQATVNGEMLYKRFGFRRHGVIEADDGSDEVSSFAVMWRDALRS